MFPSLEKLITDKTSTTPSPEKSNKKYFEISAGDYIIIFLVSKHLDFLYFSAPDFPNGKKLPRIKCEYGQK